MRPFAPFTIFLPAIALVFASIAPAHADKPKWTMMSDSKQVSLIYGDGSEESDLVLSCKLRRQQRQVLHRRNRCFAEAPT